MNGSSDLQFQLNKYLKTHLNPPFRMERIWFSVLRAVLLCYARGGPMEISIIFKKGFLDVSIEQLGSKPPLHIYLEELVLYVAWGWVTSYRIWICGEGRRNWPENINPKTKDKDIFWKLSSGAQRSSGAVGK